MMYKWQPPITYKVVKMSKVTRQSKTYEEVLNVMEPPCKIDCFRWAEISQNIGKRISLEYGSPEKGVFSGIYSSPVF